MKEKLHDLIHIIKEMDKAMLKAYEYMKKAKEIIDEMVKDGLE